LTNERRISIHQPYPGPRDRGHYPVPTRIALAFQSLIKTVPNLAECPAVDTIADIDIFRRTISQLQEGGEVLIAESLQNIELEQAAEETERSLRARSEKLLEKTSVKGQYYINHFGQGVFCTDKGGCGTVKEGGCSGGENRKCRKKKK
jgi:hypothetical protein